MIGALVKLAAGPVGAVLGRGAYVLIGAGALGAAVLMWRGDIEGRAAAEANARVLELQAERERAARASLAAERARADRLARQVAAEGRRLREAQRERAAGAASGATGAECEAWLRAPVCAPLVGGLRGLGP